MTTGRSARVFGRAARTFAVIFVAAMLVPAWLLAHPRLTRSEPAAGARLDASPVEIRLWFSERVEISLSRIWVLDSAGVAMEVGSVASDSAPTIHVPVLRTLARGRYTVTWRTAGVDGHPLEGKFGFTVDLSDSASAPGTDAAADTVSVETRAFSATSAAYVAVRALLYAALLGTIGAIVFLVGILPRVHDLSAAALAGIHAHVGRIGAWAAWVLLIAVIGRLVLQSMVVNGPRAFEHLPLVHLTMHTQWGKAWMTQLAGALLAFPALRGLARGHRISMVLGVVAVIVLSVAPALGGHAAAVKQFSWLAMGADAVHVVSAAGWLGSLLYLTMAALPVLARESGERRWHTAAAMVHAFSPVALLLGGLVVITGATNAVFQLGSPQALWTSGYGRVLSIKLALFVLLLAVATYNWRRLRRAMGGESATERLARSARRELALGFLVIVATALLVAMPTP